MVVEECWSAPAGLERMRELVSPDYVHHTVSGDLTFDEFCRGVAWIDERLGQRSYCVEHLVVEGDRAAAYLSWQATRRADGTAVEGRGAYHCRFAGDVIAEDWDVFHPVG